MNTYHDMLKAGVVSKISNGDNTVAAYTAVSRLPYKAYMQLSTKRIQQSWARRFAKTGGTN